MEENIEVSPKMKKFVSQRVIIDTSVLLKAFVEEKNSEFVDELLILNKLQKLTLLATPLLIFEFLNSLSKKLHDQKKVRDALKKFFRANIGLIPHQYGYLESAAKSACNNRQISFYDTSYHALAKEMDGIFLTADEKYFKLMKMEGHVMLLS